MTQAEADSLVNELTAHNASGSLFLASTFYTVVGSRP